MSAQVPPGSGARPRDPTLILASTSPYRRELLERLDLPFSVRDPRVEEDRQPRETPQQRAARLALAKARAVAMRSGGALVIGSDQVAVLEGRVLDKPGNHEAAVEQLRRASGRVMDFHTGLALVDGTGEQVEVVPFRVVFRTLERRAIEAYLRRERPYQCAGSFKAEGLGIALFERLEGEDPTALIGLPLIRLVRMLEARGVAVLDRG